MLYEHSAMLAHPHFTHARARSDANRFVASQWGAGAALKNDAFKLLLSL